MDLLAFSSRQLRYLCLFSAFLLSVHSSFRERSPCIRYVRRVHTICIRCHTLSIIRMIQPQQQQQCPKQYYGVAASCCCYTFAPGRSSRVLALCRGLPPTGTPYRVLLLLAAVVRLHQTGALWTVEHQRVCIVGDKTRQLIFLVVIGC